MAADERVQRTQQTYDGIAHDYAVHAWTRTDEHAAWTARAIAWLAGIVRGGGADDAPDGPTGRRADARVADLGCGPGREAAELRAAGLAAVGVDRSTSMLRLAAAAGVPSVRGDLRRPPLRDLDGIWSSAALLHVPRDETITTLTAWRACVRTGGRLALSTSVGDDEGWEVVPYGPGHGQRTPAVPLERWFVHREEAEVLADLAAASWSVQHVEHRESHRRWLCTLATAD